VKKNISGYSTNFTRHVEAAAGTGLGMNIVLKLVSERLKGSIVVSQGHSEGAGFTIRFPQIVSEDSLEDGI
jgi:signal transduction histidine kinase